MPRKFMAIRMIVLNPEEDRERFESWMIRTLLEQMWDFFQDYGLERITFLKGNKDARQSYQGAGTRADSTAAGANADYAWVTYWTSKADNQDAWSQEDRPKKWDDNWKDFLGRCYPRGGFTPSRPEHGPPYDYLGGAPTTSLVHYGRGAGCLVEGFEVIHEWSS